MRSPAGRLSDWDSKSRTLPVKSKSTVPEKKAQRPKVVLDSNVFISAVVFGGKPREILDLAAKGLIEVATSEGILEEIGGVFEGKKFRFPAKVTRALMKEIEELADSVEPKGRINVILDDPQDNCVLECAVESGSNAIITGDSHLLKIQNFGEIEIMSLDDFLRWFKRKRY